MKLKELQDKKLRPLFNIVAYKWIKKTVLTNWGLQAVDFKYDSSIGRLGNKYTCEVIACGPECTLKPGDRFILHEYDKIGQGDEWDEEDVMFVKENRIPLAAETDFDETTYGKEITEEMMKDVCDEDEYNKPADSCNAFK